MATPPVETGESARASSPAPPPAPLGVAACAVGPSNALGPGRRGPCSFSAPWSLDSGMGKVRACPVSHPWTWSTGRVAGRAHRKILWFSGLSLILEPGPRFSSLSDLCGPPTPFRPLGPPRPPDSCPEFSHVPPRWRGVWEGNAFRMLSSTSVSRCVPGQRTLAPTPKGVFSRKTFQPNSRRESVCMMHSKAYAK